MKNLIVIIVFLVMMPFLCYAQNTRSIPLGYTEKDFQIIKNAQGLTEILSDKHIIVFGKEKNAPALPAVGCNVVVSPYEEYTDVVVEGEEIVIAENVDMAFNPQTTTLASKLESKNNPQKDTYQDRLYPKKTIDYSGCNMLGGYKILSFLVNLFRYDSSKRVLYFISHPQLEVTTKGHISIGTSGRMKDLVKKIVVNDCDVDSLYKSGMQKSVQLGPSFTLFEYLIITNDELKNTFQKLADWKTQKGIPTKVLTTSYITANYQGSTLQEKIKNALKAYYDSTEGILTYALLGGDANIVPVQYCYAEYVDNTCNIPTDLYYACFDTMNWDTNENGISGEISDNVDLLPELYISRLPVRTTSEAQTIINRIISYEANPICSNSSNEILLGGSKETGLYNTNMGLISDAQYNSQRLYRDYVDPYWQGGKMEFYDTYTDFQGGADYHFSSTNLQGQLEKGYGFIHIMTHGNQFLWNMEPENDWYSINNAANLNNKGESLILTNACFTNAFDSVTTCLSESFIRNPNSGVIGYIGSSREGFGYESSINIGPSNRVNGLILKEIFTAEPTKNFARCVMNAKSRLLASCNTYDYAYRWLLYSVNPLGDPEMPIYTAYPYCFSDVELSYDDSGLNVNPQTPNSNICLTGRDNTCFHDYENVSSAWSWPLLDGEYNVCITKQGFRPLNLIFSINHEVNLQNESFWSDTNINTTMVNIGRDIKPSSDYGKVTIEPRSHVSIKSNNGVYIKNDFEVKKGASLEITQ